jgi:hypothetical protein
MATTAQPLLETIENLSRFHREHEKFYAQAPLETAISLQRWSGSLKALADHWRQADPVETPLRNPYAGCEDLNAQTAIDGSGILFLEGEGEPAEIRMLQQELSALVDRFAETGDWLARAMESSWESARALLPQRRLADLLGERHRIIANDWEAAGLNALVGRVLRRAGELLAQVDFAPAALRADLAGPRDSASYVYSACELIDHAADLIADSAKLVHGNERRWRLFHDRVASLTAPEGPE